MKSFITFGNIEILDDEKHFNWANLTVKFPTEAGGWGSDCTINIHVRIPKEHQNIETIRTYAISKAKEFLSSAKDAKYIDDIS